MPPLLFIWRMQPELNAIDNLGIDEVSRDIGSFINTKNLVMLFQEAFCFVVGCRVAEGK